MEKITEKVLITIEATIEIPAFTSLRSLFDDCTYELYPHNENVKVSNIEFYDIKIQ